MAIAKITSSEDIILGVCTVANGSSRVEPDTYNPYPSGVAGSQIWASGDSLNTFQVLENRFKYHGGVGGSGNWEH